MTKKFPLTNWSEKKAFTIKLGAVRTDAPEIEQRTTI